MLRPLQKVLNLSEMKLPPEFAIIFLGTLYSAKIILYINIRLSADISLVFLMIRNFLDDWELAMVICNAKILFIIESEHVCTNYVPWSFWDVMMDYVTLWLHLLKCKTWYNFYKIFNVIYVIYHLAQYMDLHSSSFVFFYTHVINVELGLVSFAFSISGMMTEACT